MKIFGLNLSPKESIENYPGILVPLSQAHRRSALEINDGTRRPSTIEKSSISDAEKGNAPRRSTQEIEKSEASTAIEDLRAEILAEVDDEQQGSAYELKSLVINKAIQDIGMGKYNWELFILCGLGWFADNLWFQGIGLTLPALSESFGISENHVRYTTCYFFFGLCIGASFWGVGSDIMGRRLAFNVTLLIASIFGTAVGAAQSWITVCWLYLFLGFGIGGNIPVDGALFLEFLPNASSQLLTLLSAWWPVGQLVASLLGWAFMGTHFAPDKGWRYFLYAMGGLTFTIFIYRSFFFKFYESPKFLLSQGRQSEAVAVIHGIAYRNKTTTWLTEEILNEIGGDLEATAGPTLTPSQVLRRKLASFSTKRIGPLFATKKLGLNTALLWFCWITIGLGYPLFNSFLPQYLAKGESASGEPVSIQETYRNYAIASVTGVPGSLLACYTVEVAFIGRKGTMAIATLLSAIFLFLFTSTHSAAYQLAFASILSFFQNIMYGVLYAYTPEVFPAPSRGTGTGISSLLNRIGGLCAPIIAANIPVGNPNDPILGSGGLILAAFVAMLFLTIETRGRQIL